MYDSFTFGNCVITWATFTPFISHLWISIVTPVSISCSAFKSLKTTHHHKLVRSILKHERDPTKPFKPICYCYYVRSVIIVIHWPSVIQRIQVFSTGQSCFQYNNFAKKLLCVDR